MPFMWMMELQEQILSNKPLSYIIICDLCLDKQGFYSASGTLSEPEMLQQIDTELQDYPSVHPHVWLQSQNLGIEWQDHFRLNMIALPLPEGMTKRALVSEIAQIFDILGWFSHPPLSKYKFFFNVSGMILYLLSSLKPGLSGGRNSHSSHSKMLLLKIVSMGSPMHLS